jgi:hypothetical protein
LQKKTSSEPYFFESLIINGLSCKEIRVLAYECGFMKRSSKKIQPIDFLALMCLESLKGSPSYNDLASRFDTVYGISASKQAVWKKVNNICIVFFQAILSKIIKSKICESDKEALEACGGYKRILIQDSTIIKLPFRLFEVFSGVSNASAAVCNARIQGVYDLRAGCFISFSLDPYTKNDLRAAPELDILQGDLVLRDRGYYTMGEISRHINVGADCIYRYKHKSIFLDTVTNEAIDLVGILEREGSLDIDVCLNDEKQTKVRLIAAPVSKEMANKRRMKAKKEMKGHKPPQELLHLMSWTIFITTIPRSQADFFKILAIYGLRWRIETIFKSWKSHMHFGKVHNVSENQLRVLLTARLIMIVIYTNKIYHPCFLLIREYYDKELSMLKFFNYLTKNPEKLIEILIVLYSEKNTNSNIFDTLRRYCCYDNRKRLNYCELERKILLS